MTRDRWQLTALAAVITVTAIVSSLGAPLVPRIAETYDVTVLSAQWSLTATLVVGAVVTPILGRLGSGRLRRPTILGGLVVVLLGTVLSALPLGFGALVAGRALQGVGLALVPLALAVARDAWTGRTLTTRLSLLSVTTVAGAGLGYPVTSLVAGVAGVAGAYVFGAVLVAATTLLAARFLPPDGAGDTQRVDLVGAVLLAGGTIAVLLGITEGEHEGWAATPTLGLIGGGLALTLLWVGWTLRAERRGGHPLVDLALATRPGVVGPHVVTFALGLGMYGLLALVVLVVQADGSAGYGLGYGVAAAGLVLVPYSLLSVGGSQLARRVARRWTPALLLPVGCTVFAAAMALLALAHDSLLLVLVAMAVGGLGSGFTFSSLPGLIVPHVPQAETGSALAFNQLLRYLGFSVGSASSVALLEVYGGDGWAFTAAALSMAAVCLAAGVGIGLAGLRGRLPL